jgi:hypothetical protein
MALVGKKLIIPELGDCSELISKPRNMTIGKSIEKATPAGVRQGFQNSYSHTARTINSKGGERERL